MTRLWCRLFHRKHWRTARFFVLGEHTLPMVCARCNAVHYAGEVG